MDFNNKSPKPTPRETPAEAASPTRQAPSSSGLARKTGLHKEGKSHFIEGSQLLDLIGKAQAGDLSALETIVKAYQKLIARVVHSQFQNLSVIYNQTSNAFLEIDDLLSIAQSAFILAVQTFSPTKSPNFVSFASFKIKFELFQQVKKLQGPFRIPEHIFRKKKFLDAAGIDDPNRNHVISRWATSSRLAAVTSYSSHELPAQLIANGDIDLYELYKMDFLQLIETIFSKQARELFALKIEGFSCKEIALRMKITQKQVSETLRQILGKTTNLEELEERLIRFKEGWRCKEGS